MSILLAAFLVAVAFTPFASHGETEVPAGLRHAAMWMRSCELLERRLKGATVAKTEESLAAVCQGAISGMMAVDCISTPYLPFCEGITIG
jgi:hypothetical protein